MKRIIFTVIVCCCFIICNGGGCNKPGKNAAMSGNSNAQNRIPPGIAGTWQMREGVYKFVIEPNGTVSSALIPLLYATIHPHQMTKVEMYDGNFSEFYGGDMTAEYNPANRELLVFIELKDYLIKYSDVRTGGKTSDRFTGIVSKDGKVWKGEWITLFDYGPDLPQDPNSIEPLPFTFDKVELNQSHK